MPHKQTASHDIPCVVMSRQAVVAIMPPTVRFALHLFRSPFVLNASVMSTPASSLVKPDTRFDFFRVVV